MGTPVLANRIKEVGYHLAMRVVRNLSHFEHSSREFVTVSLRLLGLQELLEGHCAAAVGRSDAQRCGNGGHERPILSIDGIRSLVSSCSVLVSDGWDEDQIDTVGIVL